MYLRWILRPETCFNWLSPLEYILVVMYTIWALLVVVWCRSIIHDIPQGLCSLRRTRLVSKGILIVNMRRSSDRLRFTTTIPIPIRQHLFFYWIEPRVYKMQIMCKCLTLTHSDSFMTTTKQMTHKRMRDLWEILYMASGATINPLQSSNSDNSQCKGTLVQWRPRDAPPSQCRATVPTGKDCKSTTTKLIVFVVHYFT